MNSVDLTLQISEKLPTFLDDPHTQFISWSSIEDNGYNLEMLFLSSHCGTHMDAPYHFFPNGLKIDKIDIERFICNAVLIRVRKDQDQSISKSDIIKFEQKHGKIPSGGTVVFSTGWSKNITKKNYFKNNPGLSSSAAIYLAGKRLNLIGIDSPSIDLGINSKFTAHHILARNNILIVENLCKLEMISSVNFKLVVLPLKLKDLSGSPVRAIAIQ